jgi:hypothetical protein
MSWAVARCFGRCSFVSRWGDTSAGIAQLARSEIVVRRLSLTVSVLCALSAACGGSTTSSSQLNLAGNWSGLLGQPGSGTALRLTWVATQAGTTISGPATLLKPATNIPATGTLSGTLRGTNLTLSYLVPNGTVPGFGACSITGNGSATATSSTISGALMLTFTSCAGSGLEPTGSDQLALTKQ